MTTQHELNKYCTAAIAKAPEILADIYRNDVNMAIWQSHLSPSVIDQTEQLLSQTEWLNIVIAATPNDVKDQLLNNCELVNKQSLCEYIQTLLDMFCTLFDLKRAGLRLAILDQAMCPKFHVDQIPCRLVSTISGPATQWLYHQDADYSKLGASSAGKSDEQSGVYAKQTLIQNLTAGDVALLKGSGWQGNEMSGLIHRSPEQKTAQRRLVLTLDFID